ncbi:3-hydroxyacyl-CoA dehydrogenase NAD-binding domain-containing protein [Longispora sp. K20-0274]|uniref:3-hydroxyacyl-CoA dehydrogenase NAD-binding domain-containing protein n=1 Tax=Longispora sp. K20-0274 TaxID=3088255 RepID=UPI00399B476D
MAVVGAGAMGTGIALTYALAGRDVLLHARTPVGAGTATATVGRLVDQLVRLGQLSGHRADGVRRRIRTVTGLDGIAEVDHVVEAVPEDLATKRDLFAELDRLARPGTLLASTTTALPVTGIAARCRRPERVLATHFYLPAHLVPLVDVVPGEHTDPAAVATACDLLTAIGKSPVAFATDAPGTVGPRLQTALLGEAFRIVGEGVATPEMVDRILTHGIGRRFGATGIFDRLDLAGLDTVVAILEGQGRPVPGSLRELVAAGRFGVKSGHGFYDWSGGRAEAAEEELARYLVAARPAPAPERSVSLAAGVLEPFLEAAAEEYAACTPEQPPSCFAVLVGTDDGDGYTVERVVFGRNVRDIDEVAGAEYEATIVPCFGAAYANARRGFWCDAKDLLRISRDADDDGLEVLGSVHLHPDWHRIGPEHERGMTISERPTPMDAYVLGQTGWPVNLICYLDRPDGRLRYTLGAWAADGAALTLRQEI